MMIGLCIYDAAVAMHAASASQAGVGAEGLVTLQSAFDFNFQTLE